MVIRKFKSNNKQREAFTVQVNLYTGEIKKKKLISTCGKRFAWVYLLPYCWGELLFQELFLSIIHQTDKLASENHPMGFSEKNDAIFEFQTIAHPLWSFVILQGYNGKI